mmetsp:Transcript_10677/g.22586  ORF Transcript_10677/g.22586 Transcript_10677/m.22586 type:complete len:206 (-) Transcript_10677:245-862(-)
MRTHTPGWLSAAQSDCGVVALHGFALAHAVRVEGPRREILGDAQEVLRHTIHVLLVAGRSQDRVHKEQQGQDGSDEKACPLGAALPIHGDIIHRLVPAELRRRPLNVVHPILATHDEWNVNDIHIDPHRQPRKLPDVEGEHVVALHVPSAEDTEEAEQHACHLHDANCYFAPQGVATDELAEAVLPTTWGETVDDRVEQAEGGHC